jgi:hypothetical protein
LWLPAAGAANERGPDPAVTEVVRDGTRWRVGAAADVAWISAGTTVGKAITSAVPGVFEAYATVVLPEGGAGQGAHDEAMLSVLRAHCADERWWLGYLETGADDIVFPDAPRVRLYSGWSYVLVQAGPEQATAWRRWDLGSFWSGHLPNLMFPTDRGWLVSTLWDDDWTCVGGSAALVHDLLRHPGLRSRARLVALGQDATRRPGVIPTTDLAGGTIDPGGGNRHPGIHGWDFHRRARSSSGNDDGSRPGGGRTRGA